MTERIIVSVSQNAVVQAESAILGCSKCTPDASMPFWQVMDHLRNPSGPDVVYVLPVLATCPNCTARIDEAMLVAPKDTLSASPPPLLVQGRI
jgi:hypothetical protein